MTISSINQIRKSRGFTMIELMLVMAIAAVMMSLKMQDDQLEMTQLNARKLGATELFVYNLGVQKYVSSMAGEVPAPAAYPKVYTGVDWLKNDQCTNPAVAATPDFVPCSFLRNSGGRTTMGAMSFTTTIDYDASTGYTARTVLSQMAGTAPGETNAGVLGMAALVASGAFIGSDASATSGGSGGSIIYCPDITPMPAGMAAICGLERDQIVMIVNTNGNHDQWLRVDHGNVMHHVIEMSDTQGATPALDGDLNAIHPNMRQIRNVARIYNVGGGNENLYLGANTGNAAVFGAAGSTTTLATNAVIIDANQEILGLLRVQGDISSNGGDIYAYDDPATPGQEGNITADGDIRSVAGNARINGWIQSDTGDLIANSGVVRSQQFVDSNNGAYYLDPASTSQLNQVDVYNLRANLSRSSIMHMRADRIDVRSRGGSEAYITGDMRLQPGAMRIMKNGTWYTLEDLIPNMTFLGSHFVTHGYGYGVSTYQYRYQCAYNKIKVYVDTLGETIQTRSAPTWENNTGSAYRQLGKLGRWVTQSGWTFYYYQRNRYDNDQGYSSGYDHRAKAILRFYCER